MFPHTWFPLPGVFQSRPLFKDFDNDIWYLFYTIFVCLILSVFVIFYLSLTSATIMMFGTCLSVCLILSVIIVEGFVVVVVGLP